MGYVPATQVLEGPPAPKSPTPKQHLQPTLLDLTIYLGGSPNYGPTVLRQSQSAPDSTNPNSSANQTQWLPSMYIRRVLKSGEARCGLYNMDKQKHIEIHTYLPTYLPTYIPTCIHTYIHTYTYIYIYTCVHSMGVGGSEVGTPQGATESAQPTGDLQASGPAPAWPAELGLRFGAKGAYFHRAPAKGVLFNRIRSVVGWYIIVR